MKKLKKSNNKVICGVCGGLAEYFNIDATIIRLIVILAVVFGFGTGVLIYILAALVMPAADISQEDLDNMKSANMSDDSQKRESKVGTSNGMRSEEEFDTFFK